MQRVFFPLDFSDSVVDDEPVIVIQSQEGMVQTSKAAIFASLNPIESNEHAAAIYDWFSFI